eukprot:SAG11_NODE_1947_length_4015_cov_20.610827_8_plen_116_part_00
MAASGASTLSLIAETGIDLSGELHAGVAGQLVAVDGALVTITGDEVDLNSTLDWSATDDGDVAIGATNEAIQLVAAANATLVASSVTLHGASAATMTGGVVDIQSYRKEETSVRD